MDTPAVESMDDARAAEIEALDHSLLLGFWAEWCLPSQALGADFAAAAERFAERLRLGLVDVDASQGLKQRYAIEGLPTVLLLTDRQVALRRVGLLTRAALLRLLDERL